MNNKDSFDSINSNNEEIRYRKLFQHITSGVVVYRAIDNGNDFIFVDINKAGEQFDSVKKEDIIGKRVSQVFTDVKTIGIFKIFQKVWKTGKTIYFPVSLYKNFRIFARRENTVYKLPTGEIVLIYDERREEIRSEKSKIAIYNISKAVNSSISLEQLYLKIHQELNQIVNTSNFFVAIYKKKEKIIVFPYFVDQYDPPPPQFSISDTNSLTVKVIKKGKSLLLKKEDILNITDQYAISKYGKIPEIWFGVPLKVKNQCIGALVVQSYDNKYLYSKKDVSLLESISDHIAFSIERKQIENALRKSEKKYRYIVNTLEEGIAIVDSNEYFIFANPATEKIFGVDKIVGTNLKKFLSEKEFKKSKEETKKRAKGEKSTYELAIIRPDQTKRIILVTVAPNFDDNNNFISSFGVFTDITDRKKLESQLIQSQKMEALGILAGGIAHDFNNILHIIYGYSELILNDIPSDSPMKNNITKIVNALDRTKELVTQILFYARKTGIDKEIVDIKKLLKEMIQFIKSSLSSSITIKYNYDIEDYFLEANKTQLLQIFMNICINASHAMKTGGKLEIVLGKTYLNSNSYNFKKEKYIAIKISDTGCGIPNEIIDKIFDPYFTTKESSEGTGLGLSVVHGLIKSYSGEITVESTVGVGTEFNIYFPSKEKRLEKEKKKIEKSSIGFERVLFVDDEILLGELALVTLQRLSYTVTAFSDSRKAIDNFKKNPNNYDIIITDMNMPFLNGIEFSKKVHKIRKNIPIIICTGYANDKFIQMVEKNAINKILQKPIHNKDIGEAIQEVLSNTRNNVDL